MKRDHHSQIGNSLRAIVQAIAERVKTNTASERDERMLRDAIRGLGKLVKKSKKPKKETPAGIL